MQTDPSFAAKWLTGHIQAAQRLGKPLLLEEVCFPELPVVTLS